MVIDMDKAKAINWLYKESKKKNYMVMGICFRDNLTGQVLPYDTDMDRRRPGGSLPSEWSKSEWHDFINRGIHHYQEKSAFSIDQITEVFFKSKLTEIRIVL